MEDLLKQQFQKGQLAVLSVKGSPPTVLPIGVACDATCSIEVNLIICLWCAHPLAVCSAETELLPAMKQMKSRQQEQLVPTVGTAI